MIRYTSTRQMSIEEFKTPFEIKLDKENRWIKLGNSLPWDAMASTHYRTMSADMDAPAIDARLVIGAMISNNHEISQSKYKHIHHTLI